MDHFNSHLERLLRLDSIRIQKVLELFQYMVLTLVISIYISDTLDFYMGELDKDKSTTQLVKEVLYQTVCIVLAVYYIPKIIMLIPFLAQHGDYIPSKKNESRIGITISMSFGFMYFQKNYKQKLTELNNRFYL